MEDRDYFRSKDLGKSKDSIREMFTSISPRYDFLNRLLSLGFDRIWRERAAQLTLSGNATKVLDVCAGTLDLSIAISSINGFRGIVVGTDFCKEMLDVGKKKVGERTQKSKVKSQNLEVSKDEIASASVSPRNDITPNSELQTLNYKVILICADTLYLPFKQNSFDAITSAFGIRNIPSLRNAFSEMRRVIKDRGKAVILEFYRPKNSLLFSFYLFYFRKILPLIGRIISRDKKAYSYLRDSVTSFLTQEEMKREMELAGFRQVSYEDLTFGIATIHIGIK